MIWFMAFLGIAVSFLVKFGKREDKTTRISFVFWMKDNWNELLTSVLMVIMIMIVFARSTFDYTAIIDKIPWIADLPMELVASGIAGYLNSELFYWIFKQKSNYTKLKTS